MFPYRVSPVGHTVIDGKGISSIGICATDVMTGFFSQAAKLFCIMSTEAPIPKRTIISQKNFTTGFLEYPQKNVPWTVEVWQNRRKTFLVSSSEEESEDSFLFLPPTGGRVSIRRLLLRLRVALPPPPPPYGFIPTFTVDISGMRGIFRKEKLLYFLKYRFQSYRETQQVSDKASSASKEKIIATF